MMNFSCIWQRWLCSVVSSMSPGDLGFHHLLVSEVLSTLIIQRSEILYQLVFYIYLNLLLAFFFLFFSFFFWSENFYTKPFPFFFLFEAGIYLLLRSSFVDNVDVNSPLAASSCNENTWKRS
mgnify:CR=1 FL=1